MAPRTTKDTAEKPARTAKSGKVAKPKVEDAAPADDAAATAGGQLKLKELVEGIAASTGGKKPEVKAVVEATLAALGEALTSGKALVVPPLGKLRVVKTKGPALTLKLRLAEPAKGAGLALADDGEDG